MAHNFVDGHNCTLLVSCASYGDAERLQAQELTPRTFVDYLAGENLTSIQLKLVKKLLIPFAQHPQLLGLLDGGVKRCYFVDGHSHGLVETTFERDDAAENRCRSESFVHNSLFLEVKHDGGSVAKEPVRLIDAENDLLFGGVVIQILGQAQILSIGNYVGPKKRFATVSVE